MGPVSVGTSTRALPITPPPTRPREGKQKSAAVTIDLFPTVDPSTSTPSPLPPRPASPSAMLEPSQSSSAPAVVPADVPDSLAPPPALDDSYGYLYAPVARHRRLGEAARLRQDQTPSERATPVHASRGPMTRQQAAQQQWKEETVSISTTAAPSADGLCVMGLLDGHEVRLLVDSGASGNFLSASFAHCRNVRTRAAVPARHVRLANGSSVTVATEVLLRFLTAVHEEDLHMLVMPLPGYDGILGR
jgi:hypothetical protein